MKPKDSRKKRKGEKSRLYKALAWLHLWLGLITGAVMLIVCTTACIWVFEDEIKAYILEPETRIEVQQKPLLSPVAAYQNALKEYPGKNVSSLRYRRGRAAELAIGEGRRPGIIHRFNPYTGEMISVKKRGDGEADFFRTVLNGHRFLWLPYKIGRPIVNYSTLVFVVILITGLVLWWPKKWNRSTRDKSFKIKTKASFKRLNYDLHNVLGFYSMLVLLALALTGMVYGIDWYSRGLYWSTSGGGTLPEYARHKSDSLHIPKESSAMQVLEKSWRKVLKENPDAEGFYVSFADASKAGSTLRIKANFRSGQSYQDVSYTFDQYTGNMFPAHGIDGVKFSEADFGVRMRKMNYDIHIGKILGLPGRIAAFFCALIGATLPITGFIIWWGRKKKKPKSSISSVQRR